MAEALVQPAEEALTPRNAYLLWALDVIIPMAKTIADLEDWWRQEAGSRKLFSIKPDSKGYAKLVEACKAQKARLTERRTAA